MKKEATASRREAMAMASGLALGLTALPRAAFASEPQLALPELASIIRDGLDAPALHRLVSRRLAPDRAALVRTTRRWRELAPDQAKRAIADADEALAGMLVLPGTDFKPGFVGNPVHWAYNPTGSSEYTASLNRMAHWQTMLRAWFLTGDERYPRKVVAELDSWIDTCVRPLLDKENYTSIAPWRALEVGIRMGGSWPFMVKALIGTEWLPPDRLARVAAVLHQHGEVLSQITPQIWPTAAHNHFLFEMTGLISVAALLPELKDASRWQEQAWRELTRCAEAQITPDGGQVEGSPHYHNIAVGLFSESLRIGKQAGLAIPPILRERVCAAMTYSLYSCRPTGDNVPWADSDSGPSAATALILGASALDEWSQLATLTKVVGRDALQRAALRLYIDLPNADAVLSRLKTLPVADAPLTFWDHGLDQVMTRTDWTARASSVFFGCHSPVFYGHSHQDVAGFDYCAQGRAIIVDPGRYTYAEGLDRRAFKSATYHNTITINDREPFPYLSSFTFGPSEEGRILRRYDLPGVTAFEALNRNFAPVTHRRLLLLSAAGDLTIIDRLDGLADADRVQLWYHFDSTTLAWNGAQATAQTQDAGKVNVRLSTSASLAGRVLPGFVSDVIDHRWPSKRLRLEHMGPGQTRLFATRVTAGANDAQADQPSAIERGAGVYFAANGGFLIWEPGQSLTHA